MGRVPLDTLPLAAATVAAALVTLLIITGHGAEASTVVVVMSMALGQTDRPNTSVTPGRRADDSVSIR